MTLQRVPWAVNGPNVAHSATLARQANFAALGGQTGIVGPDSLEVVAGETTGPFVDVMPGSGVITYAQGRGNSQNMAYAQAKDQLVPVRNDALERVDIAPTTSAGGRTDLVCVVIDDPEFEGTSDSVDYSDHQFARFHVIRGVNERTRYPWQLQGLPRPTLPLAQVRIPASTAAITNDMIHDMRRVAVTRSTTVPIVHRLTNAGHWDIGPDQTEWLDLVTLRDIEVPEWATRAKIILTLSHLVTVGNLTSGGLARVAITTGNGTSAGNAANWVLSGAGPGENARHPLTVMSDVRMNPRNTPGRPMDVSFQLRRTYSATRSGTLRIMDYDTHTTMLGGSIVFEEAPSYAADIYDGA